MHIVFLTLNRLQYSVNLTFIGIIALYCGSLEPNPRYLQGMSVQPHWGLGLQHVNYGGHKHSIHHTTLTSNRTTFINHGICWLLLPSKPLQNTVAYKSKCLLNSQDCRSVGGIDLPRMAFMYLQG